MTKEKQPCKSTIDFLIQKITENEMKLEGLKERFLQLEKEFDDERAKQKCTCSG